MADLLTGLTPDWYLANLPWQFDELIEEGAADEVAAICEYLADEHDFGPDEFESIQSDMAYGESLPAGLKFEAQ